MKPQVQAFYHQPTSTVAYLVADPASGQAALIDPPLDFDAKRGRVGTQFAEGMLEAARAQGLTLAWILETHPHADHLSAADYLRGKTGAPVATGAGITSVQARFKALFGAEDVQPDGRCFDRLLHDGEHLPLGELEIEVMETPGHTAACVSYVIGNAAFVGDTLFMPDYGTARTDFPGGDAATLYRSIRRLLDLPPETRIFTGHDYPPEGRGPAWESTVAEQRANNRHVHDGVSQADYVEMRRARDATLEPPVLMLPSLQVNIRAGALPPPEADGHVYLRLPVNAL